MAITISGSGITSANIADGTITNADINSSAAIDGSKLTGAGKVLQVVNAANNVTRRITTNVYLEVFGDSASITPTVTGSRIFASITIGGIARLANTTTTTSFTVTDGNGGELKAMANHYLYRANVDSGGAHRSNAHWFVDLGNSTTAGVAKTFNVEFKNNNTTDQVLVTHDAGDYTNITLWEMAG